MGRFILIMILSCVLTLLLGVLILVWRGQDDLVFLVLKGAKKKITIIEEPKIKAKTIDEILATIPTPIPTTDNPGSITLTPSAKGLESEPEPEATITPTPTPKEVITRPKESAKCVIDPNDLAKALKQYAGDSQLEDTLISIVSKMDQCKPCTKKETKAWLQIKMMLALKAGQRKAADKYMKQLDSFVD
jgi:hypothetical protein